MDRFVIAGVVVVIVEDRKLDVELLFVNEPNKSPTVQASRVPTAILKGNPDVLIRPTYGQHQKRSGKR